MGKSILWVVAGALLCVFASCCDGGQNVPVCFYGKVVDQNSNAVPDVKIKAIVRHWQASIELDYKLGTSIAIGAKTDSTGRFKLEGATGDGFDLDSMQKEGYEVELESRSYDAVGGTALEPVIFKMYPTNLHEKLTAAEKKFQIVPDGRSYFINLTNGTIAESGDGHLKVWLIYQKHNNEDQLYDWKCEIDVIGGGLLQDDSYYRSVAPMEGYKPVFKFEKQIKGEGRGEIKKRFYLKITHGPLFGKMEIDLCAPFNRNIPGLIRLNYAINPSGSQILR
jgi:hypothetical protein